MKGRRGLLPMALVVLPAMVWGLAHNRFQAPEYETFTSESMATLIAVTLPANPEARSHAQTVFEVFRQVDAEMSEWKDTSPLSAVNRNAGGRAVPVPDGLRRVLHRGLEIGDRTEGAFDITWAALWGLWDFKSAGARVPPLEEIRRRTALVDYRAVEVDDVRGTVRLPRAGMKIGLGGIAKGHALDCSARSLKRSGVGSFLISGGGQVMAAGLRGGRPWRVGLRDPRGAREDYFAYLELTDASASTSGDYERYFLQDGVRYHHILDPRTGFPSRGLRSVTVISPDATLADALSTGFMVMGRERALRVAEQLKNVEVVMVDEDGRVWTSPGLVGRLQQVHPPR